MRSDRQYRVYGLTLRSPIPLPIPPAPPSRRADLVFEPAVASDFPRVARPPRDWFRYRALPDGATHLEWRGLFEFLVSADGCTVRYRRLPRATDQSLGTYLLGQVVSFSLVARGVEPLHGTAVETNDGAAVFLGECGEGKSTLGAAMLAGGARIVSDDLIAVRATRGAIVVEPGPARLKLYRRVARAIVGPRREWQMHRDTAKLVLPLGSHERASRPAPLRAFYVIDGHETRSDEIRIEPLSRGAAVVELLRASFNLVVATPERERARFSAASELARVIPVRRVIYPRLLRALPRVCNAVRQDLSFLNLEA